MSAISTIFESGGSLAVRIPKRMAPKTRRVTIRQEGDALIITPVAATVDWATYGTSASPVSEDFMRLREPLAHAKRDWDHV